MVKPSRKISSSLQLVIPTRGIVTCIHVITPYIHMYVACTYQVYANCCCLITPDIVYIRNNYALIIASLYVGRHSDDMIEKLESAGLGFFIKGEETKQKLGRLVYSSIANTAHRHQYKKGWSISAMQVQPLFVIWCIVYWTSHPAWSHWCMTMEA